MHKLMHPVIGKILSAFCVLLQDLVALVRMILVIIWRVALDVFLVVLQ